VYKVILDGYSGLTLDKVLAQPEHYLLRLKQQPRIDILSIDIGSNDLAFPNNTVSVTIAEVRDFLQLLQDQRIQPKIMVFLSVIRRTVITRRNNVKVSTFVHRAAKFNRELAHEFNVMGMGDKLFVFSQAKLNFPKYIADGVHLNKEGLHIYSKNLKRLYLQYSRLLV
jgi:lysophospholipase L1-like esterase